MIELRGSLRNVAWWTSGILCCGIWVLVASAQDTSTKSPVPSLARRTEIRKLLDETIDLPKANSAAKKQQAAQRLMEMAKDSATTPDELYVVLTTALPLLREAGDFTIFLAAVDQFVSTFQVDADVERSRLITEYLVGCKTPSAIEPAVKEVLETARRAASENRFRSSIELLETAERHSKRVGATKLSKAAVELRIVVREREQAFTAQTQALKTLGDKPDDSKANLSVGQWLAVYEDDWDQALPKLALGSDSKWKAAAVSEQKASADIESQLACADAWWDVAQSATGEAKLAAQRRAASWYSQYEPNAKSPLIKARIAKRLEELGAGHEGTPQSPARSKEPESIKVAKEKKFPIGKSIDLVKLLNLPEHAMRGTWQQQNGELIAVGNSHDLVMFPVVVRGGYEIICEFTNRTTDDGIKVIFPVGLACCGITINSGNVSGLEKIDGKAILEMEPSSRAIVRPSVPAANQRHRLQIDVATNGDAAVIEALLDNQRLTSWQGKSSQLSPAHSIPCPQAIGLMKWVNPMVIHKFEIRFKPGSESTELGNDWKNSITQVALTPPKEVAAKCLNWKGRYYLFSDTRMSYPEALAMAVRLQGRLLTISSPEEEAFLIAQGGNRNFWLSAWRREESKEWRDERNRPLRYVGKWGPGQPSFGPRETQVEFRTEKPGPAAWYDDVPWGTGPHACIEWGEEYDARK